LVDANGNSYLPDGNGYVVGADGSIFNTDPYGNYYSIDTNNAVYDNSGMVIAPDGVNYVIGPDAKFYFVDTVNIDFMDVSDNVYPSDSYGNIIVADGSTFKINPAQTYFCIDNNYNVYDYTGTLMLPDGINSIFGPDKTFYFIDLPNNNFIDVNDNIYAFDEMGSVVGIDGSVFKQGDPAGTYFSVDANNNVYNYSGTLIKPDGINYVIGPDGTFYFVDNKNITLVDTNLNIYEQNNAFPAGGGSIPISTIIVGVDNSRFSTMPPKNIYYSVDIMNQVYSYDGKKIVPNGKTSIIGPDGTFYFIISFTDPDGKTNDSLMTSSNKFYYANAEKLIIGGDGSTFQKDRTNIYYSTNTNGYTFGPDGIVRGEPNITLAPLTATNSLLTKAPLVIANNNLYTFPPMVTMPPPPPPNSQNVSGKSGSIITTKSSLSPQNIDKSYSGNVNANNDFTFPPSQITDNSSYSDYDPLTSGDISKYEYVDKTDGSTQPDGLSDNPMDPNWGGVMYTQQMLDSGKYDDNIITKPMLFQPKGLFLPAVPSAISKPKDIY